MKRRLGRVWGGNFTISIAIEVGCKGRKDYSSLQLFQLFNYFEGRRKLQEFQHCLLKKSDAIT